MSASGAGTGRLWWVINAAFLLVSSIVLTSCSSIVPTAVVTPVPNSIPDNQIISILIYARQVDGQLVPILKGASVQVHGTPFWDNDDYDGYYLDACTSPQFIIATAPGYTIESVACITGTRSYTINLDPVSPDNGSNYSWISAEVGVPNCRSCHADGGEHNEYGEWRIDSHSTVFLDDYFRTMYMGTHTNGMAGTPTTWKIISTGQKLREKNDSAYGPGYLLDYPNEQGNCAYCHVPAIIQGTSQHDNLANLLRAYAGSRIDAKTEGITCDICHKVTGVTLGDDLLPYSDRPGILSLSFAFSSNGGPLILGPSVNLLPPPEINKGCSAIFSEGKFCAACHYGKFADTLIYNSYGEWLDSDYSKKTINPDGTGDVENPKYRSCQDCHMLSTETVDGIPIARRTACSPGSDSFNNFDHNMMKYGPSKHEASLTVPQLIEDAATIFVKNEFDSITNSLRITTTVENVKAGHKFPTDSPLRHLILVVEAKDELGNLLPQIGGETIPIWGGVGNGEVVGMDDYGGMPGKIYANLLADRDTNISPTAAYWNPVKEVFVNQITGGSSDTRLDPNKPDDRTFVLAIPSSGSVSITVKLIYRYAFIELVRQKGWTRQDVTVASAQCVVNPTQLIKPECP